MLELTNIFKGVRMDRESAQNVVSQYLKDFYSFALRKCANTEDAKDLTQDIALSSFRALLKRDVENIPAYLWQIAHNSLANYYRGKERKGIGIPIHDLSDEIPSSDSDIGDYLDEQESIRNLQSTIAYLSKVQRQVIILHYYEGKTINEIGDILNIPSGTIKWHLYEARKDLKKGMMKMVNKNQLKFNPISFSIMGLSGSVGSMGGTGNFFRSILSQNIAYCVYREGKKYYRNC